MVRRCSDKLAKLLMVVFNGIFLVCGIAILVLGIMGVHTDGNLKTLIDNLSGVTVAVMIVGLIISAISFMGFCGAWRESSCLITSFMLCMFVILIAELAVAGVAFTNRDKLKDLVHDGMTKSFEKRNETIYKEAWDDIQTSFNCCGPNNPEDYHGKWPLSCCRDKVEQCTEGQISFRREGCIKKVEEFLRSQYMGFGVAAIIVAFIEVVGIIFSCCLRSAINEKYETV